MFWEHENQRAYSMLPISYYKLNENDAQKTPPINTNV
jgi:hypothetical protein